MVGTNAQTLNVAVSVNRKYLQANKSAVVYVSAKITANKASRKRLPFNVCLLFDTSSSMRGDKIDYAKASAKKFLAGLSSHDYASIVTFDTETHVVMPCSHITDKSSFEAQVDSIKAEGQSNLYSGLQNALQELQKPLKTEYAAHEEPVQRVILLSDGRPYPRNHRIKEYVSLARTIRDNGITITCFGIGSDYNEDLLTALANNSTGVWHHISTHNDIPGVFSDEFKRMGTVVQTNAHLELKLNDHVALMDVFCIHPQIAEIKNIRHEDDRILIPLTDIIGGEEQTVSIKLKLPKHAAGDFTIGSIASLTHTDRNEEDVVITYTDDEKKWSAEQDNMPRTTFMVAQTTVASAALMDSDADPEKTFMLENQLKTVIGEPVMRKDKTLKTQMNKLKTVVQQIKKEKDMGEEERKKAKDVLLTTYLGK